MNVEFRFHPQKTVEAAATEFSRLVLGYRGIGYIGQTTHRKHSILTSPP
jgi:hypothetical protein